MGLAQAEVEGKEGDEADEARPRRLGRDHPGSSELAEEEEGTDDDEEEEEVGCSVIEVKVVTKR